MSLIPTEEAAVLLPVEVGTDALNGAVVEWREEGTATVVVSPVDDDDLTASNRPYGTAPGLTVHFPSSWGGSLRGARLSLRGAVWEVEGDPEPYSGGGLLGYDRPVRVRRVEG